MPPAEIGATKEILRKAGDLSEDDFATLIAAIYRAAADARLWPDALCRLADAFGAPAATLSAQGERREECFVMTGRIDPLFVERYVAHYHRINPIWARYPQTPTGTIMTDSMAMAKPDFMKTEFFNDFLVPQGTHAMLNGVTALFEGRQTVVTVQGGREFEGEEIDLFRRLVPHLRSAVDINIKIATLSDNWRASAEALHGLDQGAFLVGDDSRVFFINVAGERLCEAGGGLLVSESILHAALESDTRRVHAVVAACGRSGVDASAGGAVLVARGPTRQPLSLRIMPLRGEAAWPAPGRPVAAIFATDPDNAAKKLVGRIRKQFGFTAAESAFAIEIIKGDGVQASADRLSIARSTARTHLSRIFDKTGKRRQAEVVALLLRLARV